MKIYREPIRNIEFNKDEFILQMDITEDLCYLLTSNNRLYIWGYNLNEIPLKQTNINSSHPVEITNQIGLNPFEKIMKIAMSNTHIIFLTSNNRVLSQGTSSQFQFGDNIKIDKNTILDITSNLKLKLNEFIIDVLAGDSFALCLTTHQRFIIFGLKVYNNIFNNKETAIYFDLPVNEVIKEKKVTFIKEVKYKNNHLYFVSEDTIYISSIIIKDDRFKLGAVEALRYFTLSIKKVEIGNDHGIVLLSDNNVQTFGYNTYGQLGFEVNDFFVGWFKPISFLDLKKEEQIIDVFAGGWSSGILTSSNRLLLWGNNHNHQLSRNNEKIYTRPIALSISSKEDYGVLKNVFLFDKYSVFVFNNNKICTKGNFSNQTDYLNYKTERKYTPTRIDTAFNLNLNEKINNILFSSKGFYCITNQNNVFSWNTDFSESWKRYGVDNIPMNTNQIFNLSINEHIVKISSSSSKDSIMALTNSGRLFAWGNNKCGQLCTGSTRSVEFPQEVVTNTVFLSRKKVKDFYICNYFTLILTQENHLFICGDYYEVRFVNHTLNSGLEPQNITNYLGLRDYEKIEKFSANYRNLHLMTSSYRYINISEDFCHESDLMYLAHDEYIRNVFLADYEYMLYTSKCRVLGRFTNSSLYPKELISDKKTPLVDVTNYFKLSANEVIIDAIFSNETNVLLTSSDRLLTWRKSTYSLMNDLGVKDNSIDLKSFLKLKNDDSIKLIQYDDDNDYFAILTNYGHLFVLGNNSHNRLAIHAGLIKY